MVPHAARHPNFVDGCFACKLRTVSFAASAMPSRAGGAHAADVNATEKRWDRDMAAYKRLRHSGVQPRGIDGSARVEAKATEEFEVTSGQMMTAAQRHQYRSITEGAP